MLDVKIPSGTAEGQVLRLRQQGGAGMSGGPSGDALIEIHVTPHPHFKRDGQDIRLVLPVSLADAVLGDSVAAGGRCGSSPMRQRNQAAAAGPGRAGAGGFPAQSLGGCFGRRPNPAQEAAL